MARTSLVSFLASLCALLALTGCGGSAGPTGPIRVTMDYPGNVGGIKPPTTFPCAPVYVTVKNYSKNPEVIGESMKSKPPLAVLTNPEKVEKFFATSIEKEFPRFNIELAASPDKAKRLVTLSLTRVWVYEDNTFNASVTAQVEIRDQAGTVLMRKGFVGYGKRWGSNRDPQEFNLALTNAAANLLNNLFGDNDFMAALAPQC